MKKSIFLFTSFILMSVMSMAQNNTFPTTGNVGIGTTSPQQKLDVNGTAKVGNGDWGAFIIDGKGKNDWLFNAHNSGNTFGIRTQRDNGEANWSFQVLTAQRSTGNIGIGTTSPSSKLHVAGDGAIIKLQNTSYEDTNDSFYGWIGGYDKSGDEIWWLGEGSSNKKILGLYTNRDGYDLNLFNKGKGITIKNSGNIGIGTTTPGSKLAVNGKIHAKEVKIDLSGWPDYVFEETYDLPTLTELEQHIQEKGHLPNIPSATVVEKEGILLGEMNAKLLEKIEELTLYLIEQNKKTEQLQKEVELLKKKNK